MTPFTISVDFPKNEIEFDQRFSNPEACYRYLLKHKWATGFICKKMRPRQILVEQKKSVYLLPV